MKDLFDNDIKPGMYVLYPGNNYIITGKVIKVDSYQATKSTSRGAFIKTINCLELIGVSSHNGYSKLNSPYLHCKKSKVERPDRCVVIPAAFVPTEIKTLLDSKA